MTYYKSLTKDNKGPFSNFDFSPYLPKGKRPGKWLPKVIELSICESGYHGCKDSDILEYVNENIYEIDVRGNVLADGGKFAARQIRLTRHCIGWNEKTARLFACDCAERVLSVYEKKCPENKRPRLAIETARRFANGKATSDELSAAWYAAWSATWSAGRSAAESAAWCAAESATESAGRSAAESAAWCAAESAAESATGSAGRRAAKSAARDKEREWQKKRLLKLLEAL